MNLLYFDCFSGISGDMTVGALVDAGADPQGIENELAKMNLGSEYSLHWTKVIKKGISATKFDVEISEQVHTHRHYSDIVQKIEEAGFNDRVTQTALKIFEAIGRAEGKIHGIPLEKVHFHEVGAVDSIIDIVGTAIAVDQLSPDKIVSSPVPVGNGRIRIDHGLYPVPAPATLEILRGIPLQESEIEGEMTTPTGAGIIAVLSDSFGTIPAMQPESIGYGAGTKEFADQPNVLRVITGRTAE
ncbi:MAG TPA: nickel pincer cofactor biosynthesis protein LarC [Bacillales bacterium]|nr:nickel pincer cofactor biosynthesis protein LarC [Bacillales bacterium]